MRCLFDLNDCSSLRNRPLCHLVHFPEFSAMTPQSSEGLNISVCVCTFVPVYLFTFVLWHQSKLPPVWICFMKCLVRPYGLPVPLYTSLFPNSNLSCLIQFLSSLSTLLTFYFILSQQTAPPLCPSFPSLRRDTKAERNTRKAVREIFLHNQAH